jgi:hypothetical protein
MLPPSSPWRWRQQDPPKRWYPISTPNGVTTHKTSTWNLHRSENLNSRNLIPHTKFKLGGDLIKIRHEASPGRTRNMSGRRLCFTGTGKCNLYLFVFRQFCQLFRSTVVGLLCLNSFPAELVKIICLFHTRVHCTYSDELLPIFHAYPTRSWSERIMERFCPSVYALSIANHATDFH